MQTLFNFQVRPQDRRVDWQRIPVHKRKLESRVGALQLAKRLSRRYKAEVRLAEGLDALKTSGTYIRDNDESFL